jgi:hypothetical protein
LLVLSVCVVACNASRATDSTIVTVPGDNHSRTVAVPVGDELRIVLGNVGPGTFEAPPLISSPTIVYRDVTVIPPFTPAGPTQQFRFTAVAPGTAIVHFRRFLDDSVIAVVEDTIEIH